MDVSFLGIEMPLGSWGEWAAAIGTMLAVLGAFVVAPWNEWRRRPKLSLAHRGYPDHLRSAPFEWRDSQGALVASHPSHWVQLEVAAKSGRRTAHSVQLLMLQIERQQLDGTWKKLNHEASQFSWSNTAPDASSIAVELAPGMGRKADILTFIGLMDKDGQPDEFSVTLPRKLLLQVTPVQSGERSQLSQGRYKFLVAITARDVDARKYSFELRFDSDWIDGTAMWDHLAIENLKPTK